MEKNFKISKSLIKINFNNKKQMIINKISKLKSNYLKKHHKYKKILK